MMPDDEEIEAEMYEDIMKLGNGIRCSPCLEMKPRRWEKHLTNEYTEKDATPATAIADRLRIESES